MFTQYQVFFIFTSEGFFKKAILLSKTMFYHQNLFLGSAPNILTKL